MCANAACVADDKKEKNKKRFKLFCKCVRFFECARMCKPTPNECVNADKSNKWSKKKCRRIDLSVYVFV